MPCNFSFREVHLVVVIFQPMCCFCLALLKFPDFNGLCISTPIGPIILGHQSLLSLVSIFSLSVADVKSGELPGQLFGFLWIGLAQGWLQRTKGPRTLTTLSIPQLSKSSWAWIPKLAVGTNSKPALFVDDVLATGTTAGSILGDVDDFD